MAYRLTWLPALLQEAGLKTALQPGWETRGRGDMDPVVRGIICHHTAGPSKGNMPSLGVITNGRPNLAGPLAQLGLGRDGTYYVVAAGRANHAGAGSWQGVAAGNGQFIGIEAENTGLFDDPWPAAQLDAYCRGVAAILKKLGAPALFCCGHKEYALPAGRKTDPSFPMDEFRAKVQKTIDGGAAPILIPARDETGRPTLRRGANGDLVTQIQKKLGIMPADGAFEARTEAAIRDFQRQNGLVPDGIVGPKTWERLGV